MLKRLVLGCICFLFISMPSMAEMVLNVDTINVANDSVMSSTDSVAQNTDTLVQVKKSKPQIIRPAAKIRPRSTEVWVFITCCLTFFLAGINRRINEKKHDQSVLGFINFNLLGQSTDRSFFEFNIHQLLGLIVHNLILSLWIFYFLHNTDYQFVTQNLLFYILLFFMISIIYLCKFFFQYLLLNILQINDLPVLLVKCTIGLGYFTSLISLPLFMVIYYIQYPEWQPVLLNLFVIILGIYLLFRLFKYLQLFAQYFGTSLFYNILYFCGLELLPMMVFIKAGMGVF